jgi:hypothetical protein
MLRVLKHVIFYITVLFAIVGIFWTVLFVDFARGAETELVDPLGHSWHLQADQTVTVDGVPAAYTYRVTNLQLFDGEIYQRNWRGGWWRWDGARWLQMSGDPHQGEVRIIGIADAQGVNQPVDTAMASIDTPAPPADSAPAIETNTQASPTAIQASPQNTIISGPGQSLTDKAGQHWTISGGAVQLDGTDASAPFQVSKVIWTKDSIFACSSDNHCAFWSGCGHWIDTPAPDIRTADATPGASCRPGAPPFGNGFAWGVNVAAGDGDPTAVINDIRTMGLRSIRTGCGGYRDARALMPATCGADLNATLLVGVWPQAGAGEDGNYRRGYDAAKACASEFGPAGIIYEASNEVDNWVHMQGDGSDISQYDQGRYREARGLIRGMVDGVHAAGGMVEVHNAGWCHYGFMQALWNDGIRWDITGEHWYGDQGSLTRAGCGGKNVAAELQKFGRPIIITEINANSASGMSKVAMGDWLSRAMPEIEAIAGQYGIIGAQIFRYRDIPEGNWGLIDRNGSKSEAYAAVKIHLTGGM